MQFRRLVLYAVILCWFSTSNAQAEWMRADTPHFRVYADSNVSELADLAISLEQFDASLRQWLRLSPETDIHSQLNIYLLKNRRQIADLAQDADHRTTGFYRPSAAGSFIVAYQNDDSDSQEQGTLNILFHEYTHHLMTRELSVIFPAWLEEGAAEYFGNVRFLKSGHALPMVPVYRFQGDIKWMPVAKLLSLTGSDLRGALRETFYRQSWLLFAYMRADASRSAQLDRYMEFVREGASPSVARLAFGEVDGLYNDLMQFLRGDSSAAPMAAAPPIPKGRAISAPLTKAEVTAMPYSIALQVDPEAAGANPETRRSVLKLVDAYPESPAIRQLAAELLLLNGQYEEALANIDRALSLQQENHRAMLLKGRILVAILSDSKSATEKAWQQARSWIIKANRTNTEDPLPLLAYYTSFEKQGVKVPPDAHSALTKAYDLVPEDPSVRLAFGISMILQGNHAEAKRALEILANAPHDSAIAEKAAELLAKIRKK